MTLTWQLDAGLTSFFMNGIDSWLSLASAGIVWARSLVRPPSSWGRTRRRSWWKKGRLASIIDAVESGPGTSVRVRARANWRSGPAGQLGGPGCGPLHRVVSRDLRAG